MDETYQRAFGARLRKARKDAKMTVESLGRAVGKTKQAVSFWETGRWLPEHEQLYRIAQVLRVDLNWLMTGRSAVKDSGAHVVPAGRSIPRLTQAELLAFAEGKLKLASVTARQLTLSGEEPRTLVAFELATRSMETGNRGGLPAGSLITLKLDKTPEPGDIVAVALLARPELLVGRWRPGATGQANSFEIAADNPDFTTRQVTPRDRPKILGTMIEVLMLRSR